MSTIIQSIENEQLQRRPRFDAGDRVRVHFQVIEGSRTRTQVFEGVVIKRQGSGARETFTVRKQSFGVGVERTFPVHSPKIEQLEIAGRGDVRRAKLYYLRDRVGKAARVAERRWGIDDETVGSSQDGAMDAEGSTQGEAPDAVPAATDEDGDEAVVAEAEAGGDASEAAGEDADATSADDSGEAGADAEAAEELGEDAEPGTGNDAAESEADAEAEGKAAAGSKGGEGSSGQGD